MKESEKTGNVWFTSDQHYGHTNIIRFCERPFASIEEMDEALIANYNECVKPGDTVYHLGDFSFARNPAGVFYRLNGNKLLLLGNHDWKRTGELKKLPWGWIKDVYNLRVAGTKIWLNHFAQRAWPAGHHGAIHLYGHSHGSLPDFGRSTDVGVDAWDYRPVHLDEILDLMKGREKTTHH
jgi:calcineurin-like phosphoesterase family protein